MLSTSVVIKNKWKISGRIGAGAFGETYAGYDLHTGEEVAIKVERFDNKKMVLKIEVIALKKLQVCSHVVRYIHSGRQDDFNFLVMERLGDNLAELRKRMKHNRFSLCTTIKLGVQMLDAIEGVHNLGYIHRDIKPSNFVIGKLPQKRRRTFLIDFGLARKYRLPSGEIRPPRKSAGFRGTARYASVNSHKSKELSRRDDLWSLFYVIVEFTLGSLPWRKTKDKDQIGQLKEKYTNSELVKELPHEFTLFLEHLFKLGYSDTPDYEYLRSILLQVYSAKGYPADAPFDWESDSDANSQHRGSLVPSSVLDQPMGSIEQSDGRLSKDMSPGPYHDVMQRKPLDNRSPSVGPSNPSGVNHAISAGPHASRPNKVVEAEVSPPQHAAVDPAPSHKSRSCCTIL
eukprot:gb/GECH01004822.1/.p1 GENE.gb/GECH01004822.1/~~gb/GECH01004822.1/.p1  ORF type:complete len:400 (+),score=62.87 gb/GECH01004822.1/:1-1200(+)